MSFAQEENRIQIKVLHGSHAWISFAGDEGLAPAFIVILQRPLVQAAMLRDRNLL